MIRSRLAPLFLILLGTTTLAASRPLAPPPVAASPYRAYFPATASASGGFLTVWREDRLGLGTHIVGSLSDVAGRRISPESFLVVANANPAWMRLVSTGDGYTLFWSESAGLSQMAELDASGRVLSVRPFSVAVGTIRDIVWDGSHFVIVIADSPATGFPAGAWLFTRQGEAVQRVVAIQGSIVFAHAIVAGDQLVVVTSGQSGLTAYRIAADGRVTETLIEANGFNQPYRTFKPLALARGDGSVLIVWSSGDTVRSELRSAILSATNEVTEPRLIGARDAREGMLSPLHLTIQGDRYLLTLLEYVLTGTTDYLVSGVALDASGAVVARTPQPVSLGIWPPTAASNGQVTVVAYTPQTYVYQRVLQRTIAASTVIDAPDLDSSMPVRQAQPILGAGGGRMVGAWQEESADGSRVRLASLDLYGEPGETRVVAEPGVLPVSDLAWNGTEHLLVWLGGTNNVNAVRLDAWGRVLDAQPLVLGGASAPGLDIAAAWAGDKWIVAWITPYTTGLAHVSFAGVAKPLGELRLPTEVPPNGSVTLASIALAADENRMLVAWIERRFDECMMPVCGPREEIAGVMRFRHEGAPSTRPVDLAVRARHVAIANSGTDFLVVTDSANATTATLFDDDYGMTLLRSHELPAGLSDVAWDGAEYVIAQRHRPHGTNGLVVTRLSSALEETAAPRGADTASADVEAPPSVAISATGEAFIAVAEGNARDGSRAVVYAERDLEPLPVSPPRRRAVR